MTIVGAVMKYVKDIGLDDNTIIAFSTDNGAENFTWPDGGQTPFAGGKGTVTRRRLPRAVHHPLAGPGAGRQGRRTASFPGWTGSRPSSRRPEIPTSSTELKQGKQLGDQTYKVHLDGYNQMDCITGKGPSERHEIFYLDRKHRRVRCGSTTTSTASPISPAAGSVTTLKVDWPILTNLRLDPFERTGMYNGKDNGSIALLQLVRVRVLAVCVRAAGDRQGSPDASRVPADAERRELQPGCPEGGDGETDARSGEAAKDTANNWNDLGASGRALAPSRRGPSGPCDLGTDKRSLWASYRSVRCLVSTVLRP